MCFLPRVLCVLPCVLLLLLIVFFTLKSFLGLSLPTVPATAGSQPWLEDDLLAFVTWFLLRGTEHPDAHGSWGPFCWITTDEHVLLFVFPCGNVFRFHSHTHSLSWCTCHPDVDCVDQSLECSQPTDIDTDVQRLECLAIQVPANLHAELQLVVSRSHRLL